MYGLGKLAALVLAGLTLSACVTTSSGPPPRVRAPEHVIDNIGQGSVLEHRLSFSDTAYMSEAFSAVMREWPGASEDWYNPRSGARGIVRGAEAYLLGTDYARGRRLIAPVGLEASYDLEPDQGDYTTSANTNVRLGASTSTRVVTTIPEGTVLEAVGRVEGRPWMLVARGGEVAGYMHTDYLVERQGGDVLLAGGASRRPTYCRDYEQTLSFRNGAEDQWRGTACQNGRGRWAIEGGRPGS